MTTPQGYVRVWSYLQQADPPKRMGPEGFTSLQFVHEGKDYWRSYKRFFGAKYLATLAHRFVKDAIAGRIT